MELTHREKLQQYKNQKMKEQNLRDQHAWKLRTEMDQVKMAIHMNSDQHKRALSRAYDKAEDARRRAFDRSPGQSGYSPRRSVKPRTASTTVTVGRMPLMHQKKRLFDGIKIDLPVEEQITNLLMPLKHKRASQGSRAGHAGIKLANLDQGGIEPDSFAGTHPKSFLTQLETTAK